MSQQDLAKRPGWLLWQLSHTLEQRLIAALGEHGLTLVSFGALQTLAAKPGISTADLAREALVTPQNMSVTINRLVDEGRVTRTPHEVHGRVQRLTLTKSGQATLKKAWQIVLTCEDAMLADLSPRDRTEMLRLMRTCLASLRDHPRA